MWSVGVDCVPLLRWDSAAGSCERGNEPSGCVKVGKCIVHVSVCRPSVPWSFCVICICDKSV
jgi:hypothetical protein